MGGIEGVYGLCSVSKVNGELVDEKRYIQISMSGFACFIVVVGNNNDKKT
jgi:hypothetical protein